MLVVYSSVTWPRMSPRPRKKTRRDYHHGDLRRVIIEASLDLIREGGVGALNLREVARRAGVTHGAPHFHFADKGAVLAAIAEDGFRMLREAMLAAQVDARTPRERFEACGRGYVRFAIDNVAHFRVMFQRSPADTERYPVLAETSARAYQVLVDIVLECQASGDAPPGDPTPIVVTAWSAAHGLSALWVDGALPAFYGAAPGTEMQLASMVTSTLGALVSAKRF
jgi:AcrR family transcriptional regulator